MKNAFATYYADNSRAIYNSFILNLDQPPEEIAELLGWIDMDSWTASSDIGLGIDLIQRVFQQRGITVSLTWLIPGQSGSEMSQQLGNVPSEESYREDIAAQRVKNEAAIRLLRSWRDRVDDDEQEQRETWEYLRTELDKDRLSGRKLFP